MRTVEMNAETVRAAARVIPQDAPIVMLNLLRYREQADYGDRTDVAPCSGREAYHGRYLPATFQIMAADSVQLIWIGDVLARVIGPADEQWDEMALVEYPSFAAFQRLIENPEYKAAEFHRTAALADSRLIATVRTAGPV